MADLPSVESKLNDLEVAQNKPVTEALLTKIGSNINALIDADVVHDSDIADLESDLTTLTTRVNSAKNVTTLYNTSTFMFSDLGWSLGNVGPGVCRMKARTTNILSNYKLVQYSDLSFFYQTGPNPGDILAMPTVIDEFDTGVLASSSNWHDLTWEATATQWIFYIKIFRYVAV